MNRNIGLRLIRRWCKIYRNIQKNYCCLNVTSPQVQALSDHILADIGLNPEARQSFFAHQHNTWKPTS